MNLCLNQLYNEEYDQRKTSTQTRPLYRKTLDELNKTRATFYRTLSKFRSIPSIPQIKLYRLKAHNKRFFHTKKGKALVHYAKVLP